MKKFVFVNKSGLPAYTATPAEDHFYTNGGEYGEYVCYEIAFEEDEHEILARSYWIEGVRKEIPVRPSDYHDWDITTEMWLPNLDAARESKLLRVAAELNTRLYLPYNGFDADKVSRERISGMIARLQRGDGLPAGWVGWRDADNEMRWAEDDAATVLANLTALARAIEDREQALLVVSWTHKANVAALTDIDAILTYPVTEGWPA